MVKSTGFVGSEFTCPDCGAIAIRTGSKVIRCRPCQSEARKSHYVKHRENNREKRAEIDRAAGLRRRQSAEYREWYRAYSRAWHKERRSTPRGALDHRMSTAIRLSLTGGKKQQRWERLVGYTGADLKLHIERQFLKGMSWVNMADWHIDHIVPKSSFTYSSPEDESFKACWALTNLRPLWAKDNLSKSDARTHLI